MFILNQTVGMPPLSTLDDFPRTAKTKVISLPDVARLSTEIGCALGHPPALQSERPRVGLCTSRAPHVRAMIRTLHRSDRGKGRRRPRDHGRSSDYDLHQRCQRQPGLLDVVGADLAKAISAEIARLETEAEKLKGEIAELVGTDEVPAV
jgi:hypothetical protein